MDKTHIKYWLTHEHKYKANKINQKRHKIIVRLNRIGTQLM